MYRLTIMWLAAACAQGSLAASDVRVSVGDQQILIPAGRHNLNFFPDQPISILNTKPLTFLMTTNTGSGDGTVLMSGSDWKTARPLAVTLAKSPGMFDNGYAGVGGVYLDRSKNELLAFYHAEDHANKGLSPSGQNAWMGSVGAASSRDGGRSFRKLGQVLTSRHRFNAKPASSGLGDISICVDKTNTYLLAHYVDFSRARKHGVQTCVARSRLSDRGMPGTWKKYFEGRFSEPGLQGHESHIFSGWVDHADYYSPQVQYSKVLKKYVMVFCAVFYTEVHREPNQLPRTPKMSGVYLSTSDDAIHWNKPTQLFANHAAIIAKQKVVVHPTLHITGRRKPTVARLFPGRSCTHTVRSGAASLQMSRTTWLGVECR